MPNITVTHDDTQLIVAGPWEPHATDGCTQVSLSTSEDCVYMQLTPVEAISVAVALLQAAEETLSTKEVLAKRRKNEA